MQFYIIETERQRKGETDSEVTLVCEPCKLEWIAARPSDTVSLFCRDCAATCEECGCYDE